MTKTKKANLVEKAQSASTCHSRIAVEEQCKFIPTGKISVVGVVGKK